jgi:hypothetical protein
METKTNTEDAFMTFEEFMKNAEPSTLFDEIYKEIARNHIKDPKGLAASSKRDEEWSRLANQVVGHEKF